MPSSERGGFEWRVPTGRWRWLLLSSLAAVACRDEPEQSPERGGQLGAAALAALHACTDPVPIGGGWERCANGVTHRAAIGQCTSSLPRAQGDPALLHVLQIYPLPDAGTATDGGVLPRNEYVQCRGDSDCVAHLHGHCEAGGPDFPASTFCDYGCVTDSDCAPQQVCLCGSGPVGTCVASPCRTDADCGGAGMCASAAEGTCGASAFACQTPQDQCASASDCAADQGCDVHPATKAWQCVSRACPVIGRPFLVEGEARRASAERRADWHAALPAADEVLELVSNDEFRGTIASGWLQQALMEHASVAAFARFSLQLLSLGAPAELVLAAAQAQADEIGHARDCFALARRYSAGDLGPGPLPLAGALAELDLRSIVLGTIAEGCIGETVAALEAAEACAHCTDPAARAVLERIAEDETRHAQLAWRFVAWALETGPAHVQGEVRAAFARELASVPPAAPSSSELERRLLQHGLMSAALRAELRERVLREVIAPCADALLAGARSSCFHARLTSPTAARV